MGKIRVKLKFLLSRGKTVYVREEEVRLSEDASIGRLLDAIQQAFDDIEEVRESEELKLFVQADPRSTLFDYDVRDNDTLIIVPAMEQIEDLIERERRTR